MTPAELDILRAELATQFGKLSAALKLANDADETALRERESLARSREIILLAHASNPKQLGANEEVREATLNSMTAELVGKVQDADSNARFKKHWLELARIEHQFTRDRIRLAEVAVGIVRGQ